MNAAVTMSARARPSAPSISFVISALLGTSTRRRWRAPIFTVAARATFCAIRPRFCASEMSDLRLDSTLRARGREQRPSETNRSTKRCTAGVVSRASFTSPISGSMWATCERYWRTVVGSRS